MSKRILSLKDYRRLKAWANEAIRICNEAEMQISKAYEPLYECINEHHPKRENETQMERA